MCQGRNSAACQGQCSASPGSFQERFGEKLGVEGQSPVSVERVLHGPGLFLRTFLMAVLK